MSARVVVARVTAAVVLAVAMMVVASMWARGTTQPKEVHTTKVVEKAPDECRRFSKNADAFVAVTNKFLGVQNDALDALIDHDSEALSTAVGEMTDIKHRFDTVSSRYWDTRTGCL